MTALPSEAQAWWPEIGFGDRLRIVRRHKHRSQAEMAELLGVKKVTYSSWEAGSATPSYAQVVEVARRIEALDRVPLAWTLGAGDGGYQPIDAAGAAASLVAAGARSSTDRASDYGSVVRHFRSPFRRPSHGRRRPVRRDAAVYLFARNAALDEVPASVASPRSAADGA